MSVKVRNTSHKRRIECGALILTVLAFIGLPSVGSAQGRVDPTVPDDRGDRPVTEAERARQAERARATETLPPDRPRYHYDIHRPSELYVAGFGGYTF